MMEEHKMPNGHMMKDSEMKKMMGSEGKKKRKKKLAMMLKEK